MGLSNLSDQELTNAITQKGGLGQFLKDKTNVAKVLGLNDDATKARIASIMKNKGMSDADVKKAMDEMAFITIANVVW